MDLPAKLLSTLQIYQPGATQSTLMTLNLEIEPLLELPFTWLISSMFSLIWLHREKGRVDPVKIKAQITANWRILKSCHAKTWANADTRLGELITELFDA